MSSWVVITGAGSGIGMACCKAFKERGNKICAIDLNVDALGSWVDEVVKLDLFDFDHLLEQCQRLAKFIKIETLIHNAAFQVEHSLEETTSQEWDLVLGVNLKAPYFLSQALLKAMANPSSIINIASVHGKATSAGLSAYAASKGGLLALTRSLAVELGGLGIRVNAIIPGAIDTPMLKAGLSRFDSLEKGLAKIVQSSPLKRIGEPNDIANLAVFLSDSKLAANITGCEFVSDSGVLARLASE